MNSLGGIMQQRRRIKLALGWAITGLLFVSIAYLWLPAQRFARIRGTTLDSFAATCQALLKTAIPEGELSVDVPVERAQLSAKIRSFEPRCIDVSSNRVWMMFGGGKVTGFSVYWAPDVRNPTEWTLTLYDGARERILLRRPQAVP